MKITKFEQSCLLVEMPAPLNRTALFDPGVMSESSLNVENLEYLDDIIISHSHGDHVSISLIKELITKFPTVRITAPAEVVDLLEKEDVTATSDQTEGIVFFNSPHEDVAPLFPQPEQIGIHYLDMLTHPGDSHSFGETKRILALPVTAPWGSTVRAVNLALELRPDYVLPIHDWHWSQAARDMMYDGLRQAFEGKGITFVPMQTGEPIVIDLS